MFRFQNGLNYWTLRAAKGVAGWQLIKIVGGKGTVVGRTGLSPTRNGTVVAVSTRTDGSIGISFNGKLQSSFTDRTLADKRYVGVQAAGPSSIRPTFSNFLVSPLPG